MKKIILVLGMLVSTLGFSDYKLAMNGKTVKCYADDNQSFVLNAKRTTIKYTVEGESLGAQSIFNVDSDGDTSVAYSTEEGVLTLSDQGDTWQFAEEDRANPVECR